ncbi:hemagglutinin repeat-containing protein [Candidatus Tisiphia endosymbiont of Temnostethus pusillus]|uniref:hemagglutinin repeat-containing protein n=1 Tax=Candidatus Tisiphia endosymbiont of Temnostethus pusillus TaxID=3139335 RepID=UPI0035C8B1FB
MVEFDFYINGDVAVLALNQEHLALDTILHVHNNDLKNPAKEVFVILPHLLSTTALINWYGTIDLIEGMEADLLILFDSTTHIHNGSFKGFKSVLLSDHKIRTQTKREAILDEGVSNNAKLTVNNFYAKESYIFCNSLSLLNGGTITNILGIKLHGNSPEITFRGDDTTEKYLVIGKLDIRSPINQLSLYKVLINDSFHHARINHLCIKYSVAAEDWHLENVQSVSGLSLKTLAIDSQIFTDKIEITSLLAPRGKFYIAAKSYINFIIEDQGQLAGIDLVLDMSDSTYPNRKVIFPAHKFQFDRIIIIKADEVSMPYGGSCKQLILEDCIKVVAYNLNAFDVKYSIQSRTGQFYSSGKILNNLLLIGEVNAILHQIEIDNLEGTGLCNINFSNGVICKMLQLNLNLDAANLDNRITAGKSVIRIDNTGNELTKIDTILAKLSTFYIKGKVELGNVLIQTIDNLTTLLWVDLDGSRTQLKLDRLFVGFDHNIVVSRDGTISVVKSNRMLGSGAIYASVSAISQDYFLVKAGMGIRFDGSLQVISGDIGFFSKYGDLFVKGSLKAKDNIILVAQHGSVNVVGATLDARCITVYSSTSHYIAETIMKAQELLLYSLSGDIQIETSKLVSCKIAIVSSGDTNIGNSQIQTNSLFTKGSNIRIGNSNIITYDIFVQATHDFLLVHSGIHLVQYSHALFANISSADNKIIQGGFRVAHDVTLVGIFSANSHNPLPRLQWQQVDFTSDVNVESGRAYIDANRGVIVGSTISSKDSVIIKTKHSLEVVPLVLYNEVMVSGGLNTRTITEVVSKINAGIIDIDAGKAATFVGALFKASEGNVKAEILHLLASTQDIANQQARVKELSVWIGNLPIYTEKINVGRYFDFSQSTSICQRIGNLGIYDNYVSKDLLFTQTAGDITLDRSLTKYDKLYLNAEQGKILIISRDLQQIYTGNGGGEKGRSAAYASRTVIGGNDVYLVADQLISQAGKFQVQGTLKIITKDGVHLLPVAVHESLMYHQGSKTTVSEYTVRQVISEIHAGYLDIKAGGAFEAVSSLINVTGIKLDVKELNLRAEYDIFERHVHFVGTDKWYGGYREWQDYTENSLVLPTVIRADQLFAEINGTTTIEAAQILVTEESSIFSKGGINLLPKYDIHLHDHVSTKTYLFNFHNGKLTIASSKTVKEHFYGEKVVPTLYYSGGSFFGYSEGKIHLLGSKIIGNNIYLLGQSGVKLEAAPYHKQNIVSISETGIRTGYSVGCGEVSIGSELFKNIDKLQYVRELYEASEVIARGKLTIGSSNGNLEVISSKMQFAKAEVKVRGMYFSTHKELHAQEQQSTSMSLGIKVGMQENISGAVKTAAYLLDKRGTHWLDVLDRALNLYKLGSDVQQIAGDIRTLASSSNLAELGQNLQKLDMVKFGVWLSSKVSETSTSSYKAIAVDNYLTGGDIDIQVDEAAVIEGIICQVDNFKLKSKSLEVRASHNSSQSQTTSCEMELTIPIAGNVGSGISMSGSETNRHNVHYHDNNMIMVKGRLEVSVEGNGKVSGVMFYANEVLVRAKNLVVESLQDVVQERMQGLQMSIGFNSAGYLQSLGGKVEVGSRNAAWSNAMGGIIGTQVVNVVVQQTLEIAGGLIANAEVNVDGSLTDKGKAYVEAGSIVAKKLHDYDNGSTFGLGVTLTKKVTNNGELAWGTGMPVVCNFNERSRDIMPVIGKGDIRLTAEGSKIPDSLGRDINCHIGNTNSEQAGLNATVPISDMVEFIQQKITSDDKKIVSSNNEEKSKIQKDDKLEETKHETDDVKGVKDKDYKAGSKNKPNKEDKVGGDNDKPFDYSMLFLAKPESKELKLSPDTAALLKAILPFQQVPSSSTTAGGSDWATKEITRGLESNNFSIPTPTTSTLLPSEVDHKVVSGASQIKDEHHIQEDKLDSKLKEFIRDNQEIAKKVEEIGYEKFKQQLIEAAKVVNKKQNETKADSLKDKVSFGIKELFGIQEAEAAAIPAIREVLKYLGPLLFTYTAAKVANDNIEQEEDEGNASYYKTHTQKPPPTGQQQKAATSSTFMPSLDPGDFEPDDEDDQQNSFDPSKEENHDKIRRDIRYGKLYRDAKNDKIWYSKERSGDRAHAGEHWKQFIQQGGELIHEADIDLTGKVIDKWKSRTGAVIKLKNTIGIK